jgi:cytoskeletal protein CcmA (bactofilin family)
MRKKKKSHNISTLLGQGVRVQGVIEFTNTIRLDGEVKGKIIGPDGTLIVGEKAWIEADVNVGTAIIMGGVKGNLQAQERIEVYPPGRVTGDIRAPAVILEKGVIFNGSCAMVNGTMQIEESSDEPVPTEVPDSLADKA